MHQPLFGSLNVSRTLRRAALALAVASAALAGCAVYRPEVVQGNFISKEQAAAVAPGMPRAQVRQIMGTPLVTDLFRNDRWDYVFTLQHRRGVPAQKYAVTVFFTGDLVSRVEGGDELPTEQEFVTMLGGKKTYKVRTFEASPEQLARFAEQNKPPAAPVLPTAPATTAYPPLPQ